MNTTLDQCQKGREGNQLIRTYTTLDNAKRKHEQQCNKKKPLFSRSALDEPLIREDAPLIQPIPKMKYTKIYYI